MPQYRFYLGGYDLEMLRIKEFLIQQNATLFDKKLGWGAKASAYQREIEEAVTEEYTPYTIVLVELEVDIELPSSAIVIDHHGNRSNEPASLLQVMSLLGVQPSKWDELIAANDSGYIPAMMALGANDVEIQGIRRADRQAQGVTDEMEADAEIGIRKATYLMGMTIIRISHNKFSTVTDRLFSSWPEGKENLLVICGTIDTMTECCYFGRGDLCKSLKEAYAPNSWGGGQGYGNPEGQAFAGCRTNDYDAVRAFFENQ